MKLTKNNHKTQHNLNKFDSSLLLLPLEKQYATDLFVTSQVINFCLFCSLGQGNFPKENFEYRLMLLLAGSTVLFVTAVNMMRAVITLMMYMYI